MDVEVRADHRGCSCLKSTANFEMQAKLQAAPESRVPEFRVPESRCVANDAAGCLIGKRIGGGIVCPVAGGYVFGEHVGGDFGW